jgi:ATP-dependent RNA helicase DDX49/DBP8
MSKTFEDLGLQKWVAKQCAALAMSSPTAVQEQCIPAVLHGKHVLGGAATGSGKTAAFVLPILQKLSEEVYGVFAVTVTPSRELAYQILDQFVAFGAPITARTAIVIGGAPHPKQMDTLLGRPHVVVATPGRLRFLLDTFPEVAKAFQFLRFLVLDEADRLTDGDIADDTMALVKLLGPPIAARQTLLMTATVTDKLVSDETLVPLGIPTGKSGLVMCCCESAMRSEFALAPRIQHKYLFVPPTVKLPYLVCLLRAAAPGRTVIVFANSCFRCEVVRLTLQVLGFPVCSLNSLLTQQQRLNNLALCKSGIAKILVATDVASRGLDIPTVDLVVHYDCPKLPAAYVHRSGRAARLQDSAGMSVTLVTQHEVSILHRIERRTKTKLRKLRGEEYTDLAVLEVLDEVSAAKVVAKVQVTEQFGERAAVLKAVADERRSDINRAIRTGGVMTHRKSASTHQPQEAAHDAVEPLSAPALKKRRVEGTTAAGLSPSLQAVRRKESAKLTAAGSRPKKKSALRQ